MPQENVELVRSAYEAFGKGDMTSVVSLLAGVEWHEAAGTPYGGTYTGRGDPGQRAGADRAGRRGRRPRQVRPVRRHQAVRAGPRQLAPAQPGRRLAIVDLLRATTAGAGEPYRIGGEEFALLLPTDTSTATATVERALGALRATPLPHVGTVTASAGIAELTAGMDVAALFRLAANRLYEAKARGRDQVCVGGSNETGSAAGRCG